jgi:transcriptional regulator with XRE-family HTH domain
MLDALNKRFIELMVKTGHSKSTFAKELDVSLPLITHITNGRNKPGIELIQKILTVYSNLNARWLLLGDGEMFEQQVAMPDLSAEYAEMNALIAQINQYLPDIQEIKSYHNILMDEILHLQELQLKLGDLEQQSGQSIRKLNAIQEQIKSKLEL